MSTDSRRRSGKTTHLRQIFRPTSHASDREAGSRGRTQHPSLSYHFAWPVCQTGVSLHAASLTTWRHVITTTFVNNALSNTSTIRSISPRILQSRPSKRICLRSHDILQCESTSRSPIFVSCSSQSGLQTRPCLLGNPLRSGSGRPTFCERRRMPPTGGKSRCLRPTPLSHPLTAVIRNSNASLSTPLPTEARFNIGPACMRRHHQAQHIIRSRP